MRWVAPAHMPCSLSLCLCCMHVCSGRANSNSCSRRAGAEYGRTFIWFMWKSYFCHLMTQHDDAEAAYLTELSMIGSNTISNAECGLWFDSVRLNNKFEKQFLPDTLAYNALWVISEVMLAYIVSLGDWFWELSRCHWLQTDAIPRGIGYVKGPRTTWQTKVRRAE